MRFISANSSGKTGAYLATSLLRSKRVELCFLGSPEAILRLQAELGDDAQNVEILEFTDTRNLHSQMHQWCKNSENGIIIHAAAVGDYENRTANGKIPSGQENLSIHLTAAPNILRQINDWNPSHRIVSFKAAPPETAPETLLNIATVQQKSSKSWIVFANVLGRLTQDLLLLSEEPKYYHLRSDALDALIRLVELALFSDDPAT